MDSFLARPEMRKSRGQWPHLHLGVRDVMQAAEARILAKFLPSRLLGEGFFGPQKFERPGIGEKEEFPQVESENLRESGQNFIRRMALAGFEVADVRSRRFDPLRHYLLGQIKLAPTFANDRPEGTFLPSWHRTKTPVTLGGWPQSYKFPFVPRRDVTPQGSRTTIVRHPSAIAGQLRHPSQKELRGSLLLVPEAFPRRMHDNNDPKRRRTQRYSKSE